MMICTFFGHRDCPDSLKPEIFEKIKEQVNEGTTEFYVGNNGNFDALTLSCLRELKKDYPIINYTVVLAYIPAKFDIYFPNETLLPEGIELVPKRFAIDFRNRWMLEIADTVIAYTDHSWGGAAKFVSLAERKRKKVVRLQLE